MRKMLHSALPAILLAALPLVANAGAVPEIDGGEAAITVALVGGVIALMKMARRPKK